MKQARFILIFICIVSFQALAGLELGFNLGYGFGTGKLYSDAYGVIPYANFTAITDTTYSEWDDKYTSLGGGIKIDLDLSYYFNDNLGLYFMTGISLLGGSSFEISFPEPPIVYTFKEKIRTYYIPINIGLKLHTVTGKLKPYIFVAPGLYIPFGGGSVNDTIDLSFKFTAGFGFAAGIGAVYNITDRIGLSFEISPTYTFARLREYSEESPSGIKYITIFKKNQGKLPKDEINGKEYTTYEHGGPRYSFSSIPIKIGLKFGL